MREQAVRWFMRLLLLAALRLRDAAEVARAEWCGEPGCQWCGSTRYRVEGTCDVNGGTIFAAIVTARFAVSVKCLGCERPRGEVWE